MSVFHACSTTNCHFLRSFKLIQHNCPSSFDDTDTLSVFLRSHIGMIQNQFRETNLRSLWVILTIFNIRDMETYFTLLQTMLFSKAACYFKDECNINRLTID